MIDIENDIFTEVASAIRKKFPKAYVTGEYVRTPPSFPCISITEKDNYPYKRTMDSSSMERHAVLMYEVNVYSNKQSGKKTECREIAKVIDDTFSRFGFYRRMLNTIPNLDDATIYRIIGRYQAVVDDNKTVYRSK